jgi:hypothetical protein
MKTILLIAAMTLSSVSAYAHPGGHQLTCTSRKGAKQVVKLELTRMNGTGWAPPSFTITVDGTAHTFTTNDDRMSFGSTTHDAPLGVVLVTADNREDTTAAAHGGFSVTAIPRTVQAFDTDGKHMTWSIDDENDSCHDTNGKAVFRAVSRGWLEDGAGRTALDAQVLDCVLEYDSGMAC